MNWEKAKTVIPLYERVFPSVEHCILSVRKTYAGDKPVSCRFGINEIDKDLLTFCGSDLSKSEDEKGVTFFKGQYAGDVIHFLWVIDIHGVPMNIYSWASEGDTKTLLDVLVESVPIKSIAYLILVTYSGWCKHKPEEHYEYEIVESKNSLMSSEILTNILRLPDDEEDFFDYLRRMRNEKQDTAQSVVDMEERELKMAEYSTFCQPTLCSVFRMSGISPILFNYDDEVWN